MDLRILRIPIAAPAAMVAIFPALLLTATPAHAGVADDLRDALDEVPRRDNNHPPGAPTGVVVVPLVVP